MERRLSTESQGRATPGPKKPPAMPGTNQRKRKTNTPKLARKQSKLAKPSTPEDTTEKAEEANESEEEKIHSDEDMTLVRQSKEEVGELWDQMDDGQRQRYSAYRQTMLNKGNIKRLVSQILGQQASSTLTFVVAGFSKVFVGEIVERALEIHTERGHEGPLQPEHLREAYRLYKREHPELSSFTSRLF
ncbi:transcription initiation factor TFIID subunit 11 [Coemansia sp. RSA 2336]|nr:transcription initiation factor TFIID subunit 11 [Coemansia sp. RSA 2336]